MTLCVTFVRPVPLENNNRLDVMAQMTPFVPIVPHARLASKKEGARVFMTQSALTAPCVTPESSVYPVAMVLLTLHVTSVRIVHPVNIGLLAAVENLIRSVVIAQHVLSISRRAAVAAGPTTPFVRNVQRVPKANIVLTDVLEPT